MTKAYIEFDGVRPQRRVRKDKDPELRTRARGDLKIFSGHGGFGGLMALLNDP